MKNNILVFCTIFLLCSCLMFADNSLVKTNLGAKTNLAYEFVDYKGKKHTLSLQVNTNAINSSYNKIPNLEQLNNMFSEEIPNYAHNIMEPYVKLANEEFAFFHTNSQYHIKSELGSISEHFSIDSKCPDNAFFYKTIVKNKQIMHKLNIGGCSVNPNTENAYIKLIKDLKQIANETNAQMDDGSFIKIITDEKGYKIKISASSQYDTLMQDAKSVIVAYKEEYDNDVLFVKSVSDEIRVNYQNALSDIALDLQEDLASLGDKISEDKQSLFNEFYLKLDKQSNEESIVYIDYQKLVNEYSNNIFNFAYYGNNARDGLNFYLNFLQSIPYNTLTDRSIRGYAGFLPPIALLDANKGDCDSKSVAFLSFTSHLFRDIKKILVLTPNHAFVGVEIEPMAGDATLVQDGTTYVLAETAGPLVSAIGTISQDTQLAIDSGNIEYVLKF